MRHGAKSIAGGTVSQGGLWLAFALVLAGGCSSTPPEPYDYSAFLNARPRSILVLPPLDETPAVEASDHWLASVSQSLVARGYYVFPVALVQGVLRENGLPTPYEMHSVPLDKLHEVFGADAVLYATVKEWGTSYQVLNSVSTVSIEARLIDARSGILLWSGVRRYQRSSADSNQGGLIGLLVSAITNQIVTAISDPSDELARVVNWSLFGNEERGLLPGPYHPSRLEPGN